MNQLLLKGALMTLSIWVCAAMISLLIGSVWGIVRSRQLRIPIIAPLFDAVTFILRGIPYFVQLLIVYFVLPDVLNISIPTFVIAAGSLGLCSAAYASQIVRGGINALPIGQWEAAQVLGFSSFQTVYYIIIPQLIRNVLPALIGECDQLLKSTAILSTIGVLELTRAGMNIVAREMNPMPVYFTIAIIYLGFSSVLNAMLYWLERRGGNYAYRN